MSEEEFLGFKGKLQRQPNKKHVSGVDTDEAEPVLETTTHFFARMEMDDTIATLKECLVEPGVERKFEHERVWGKLWQARRPSALGTACEEWKALPLISEAANPRGWGFRPYPYPDYVWAYGKDFFLRIKWQDPRFPKSKFPWADESRLSYLSRGMAGIMMGVSPKTAIQHLRTLTHDKGGPLWKKLPGEQAERCICWRCGLMRYCENEKRDRENWWNEITRLMNFIEKKSEMERRP